MGPFFDVHIVNADEQKMFNLHHELGFVYDIFASSNKQETVLSGLVLVVNYEWFIN